MAIDRKGWRDPCQGSAFDGPHDSGAEALAIGLIDREDSADAIDGATRLAQDFADMSPGTLAAIKKIANGLSMPSVGDDLIAAFEATFQGTDFREGYSAFLEKRTPDFD